MKNIEKLIRQRKSIRTYKGSATQSDIEKLLAFAETIENPFSIPVTFKALYTQRDGLVCPVLTGTDTYIGGSIAAERYANLAFGYSFEMLILYAQSLGLGTVWLGGTMNRPAYEKAMDMYPGEMMPCAAAVGYAADKPSLRDNVMRSGVKADSRLPFEELFFEGSFDRPLTREKAGKLEFPLEMVRLAPSSINRQHWRVIVDDNRAHFYMKRQKAPSGGSIDMPKIDMGIALCHFDLATREKGIETAYIMEDPKIPTNGEEYIISFIIR